MRLRWLVPVLLLGLFVGKRSARAGWWDDLDKGRAVTLSDLIAQPDTYRKQIVTFFALFHERDDVFDPLSTPFNASRYDNVAVWSDGAPVWGAEAFKRDFPFLYIRRSHPRYRDFVNLPTFTRIEITGRIRAMVRSIPCIEVLAWRKTSHRVGRIVVQSMMRGARFTELGDDELAYENYKRALRPDLPPAYDLLVRKAVAVALRRTGRDADAQALEDGTILVGPIEPKPPTGPPSEPAPMPGPAGEPVAPGAPPPPITTDLPGQPVGGVPRAPGAPAGAPTAFPPPAAPAPVPAAPPSPITSDLPGEPINAPRSAPAPSPPPAAGTPPRRLPGAPSRRPPRLSGVK